MEPALAASRTPEISVALPVHNGEKYLAEAIESVLRQSLKSFELIVAENGSTDSTVEIATRYARRDRRVSLVRSQSFLPQAQNVSRSIDLCKADWVKPLCHDDRLQPDCLSSLLVAARRVPSSVSLIGHGESWLFANGYEYSSSIPSRDSVEVLPGRLYLRRKLGGKSVPPLPALTNALLRRATWAAGPDFDGSYQHFDSFYWSVLLLTSKYAYLDSRLTVKRIHSEQVAVSARSNLRSVDDHSRFWKHFLSAHGTELGLDSRAKVRTRAKASSLAATAIAIELMKGEKRTALAILGALPISERPMIAAMVGPVLRRERRRTREVREHVPSHILYP